MSPSEGPTHEQERCYQGGKQTLHGLSPVFRSKPSLKRFLLRPALHLADDALSAGRLEKKFSPGFEVRQPLKRFESKRGADIVFVSFLVFRRRLRATLHSYTN